MSRPWTAMSLATVSFLAVVFGSGNLASAAHRASSRSVPAGWRTYTYGKVKISIPKDWAEQAGQGCPVPAAVGTLNLSDLRLSNSCPAPTNVNMVTLMKSPSKVPSQFEKSCPPISVNGLSVYVGPCTSSNAAGLVYYDIPSLGIEAVGQGTSDENVTGSATIVGRILHTLRKK